ncbi:class I SAM-dependent DNA methyltransferase [Guptibacillus algicola]|uniref:class I SAM-dependent DNA methyltransferase n=1 Tax=Guptibacillus algicola TaxID=225844 RepID=UPI001CD58F87|nr:class I SAM-dependent methyltransferase [Alkalihalobacillus algicola]MCA0988639.1 class I SAM-dependent methyltransferase [Alkalihalobacillus algicola]
MEFEGSAVYENKDFYENYMKRRHRDESPNALIETPALLDLLGSVEGGDILDLGCGDATLGTMLLDFGCQSYLGIDGSDNMCERANLKLDGLNGRVVHSSLQAFHYPKESYDIVVSQLVLHYIENLDDLLNDVFQSIKENGRFVFSVQHPLLTASFKSMEAGGKRSNWIVDDYFVSGKRVEPWIGEKVVKYHRTIEEYFKKLQRAGFVIEGIREATPNEENFADKEEYERRRKIPLFLLFSCVKKA